MGSKEKGRQPYLPPPRVREPACPGAERKQAEAKGGGQGQPSGVTRPGPSQYASHKEQPRNKPKRASSQGQPGSDTTWLQPRTQTRPGTARLGRPV
ncbi:hypothetical protein NDU88_004187 [Pleurodeles waltl]|uniref:Uncharacterized protein n=1 Tax=Pleurodeles waltl TaxID=8319 RepID=A0AAV7UFE6_PLEWA|nr:hypothetical protein NDU88_004187 [Pleurodeles waltl]